VSVALEYDWPAEIAVFDQGLLDAFNAFTKDVTANVNVFSVSENAQYTALFKRYLTWHDSLNFLSYLNSSNMDIAKGFAENLRYWRDLYNSRSPTKAVGPGTEILLPRPSAATSDVIKYAIVSISAAVGLTAIAKILRG
jgi:hypothetical protein